MKVLKFGAIWCSSCIIMKNVWDKIERQIPDLDTVYYDYDMEKQMVEKYNIGKVLPVFIFLDNKGVEIVRLVGEQREKDLIKLIERIKDKK